jgi:hypothetical protein
MNNEKTGILNSGIRFSFFILPFALLHGCQGGLPSVDFPDAIFGPPFFL